MFSFDGEANSLGEGAEGVAEGLGRQVKKSLEEHVDLQRVEALTFIWKGGGRRRVSKREKKAKEGKRTR